MPKSRPSGTFSSGGALALQATTTQQQPLECEKTLRLSLTLTLRILQRAGRAATSIMTEYSMATARLTPHRRRSACCAAPCVRPVLHVLAASARGWKCARQTGEMARWSEPAQDLRRRGAHGGQAASRRSKTHGERQTRGRCHVLVKVGWRGGIGLRKVLVRRVRGVVMPVVFFSDKFAAQTEMVMTRFAPSANSRWTARGRRCGAAHVSSARARMRRAAAIWV